MAFTITIQGTPVQFPSDGESPDWAPAIIQFAQLVEAGFNASIGQYDISPQVQVIDAYNGSGTTISNLSFTTSAVRAAFIQYSVYRTTSTANADEAGNLIIIYNPNNSTNNKWSIQRDYVNDGKISFTVSDAGQVSFTTTSLAGTGHTGILSYSAKALLQS